MKKVILMLLVLSSLVAESQIGYIVRDKGQFLKSLQLKSVVLTGFQTDIVFVGDNQVPTSKAVRDYVTARLDAYSAGGGTSFDSTFVYALLNTKATKTALADTAAILRGLIAAISSGTTDSATFSTKFSVDTMRIRINAAIQKNIDSIAAHNTRINLKANQSALVDTAAALRALANLKATLAALNDSAAALRAQMALQDTFLLGYLLKKDSSGGKVRINVDSLKLDTLLTAHYAGAVTKVKDTLYTNGTTVVSVDDRYYGIIYNANSWSGTSAFTNNGSTVSVVGNTLQFSGGANTFTQSLDLTPVTMLENWSITVKFKADTKAATTTEGPGIGIRSSATSGASNVVARFGQTSGTGTGLVKIYSSASNTLVATSSTAVSFTAGDSIVMSFEKSGGDLIATAYNFTTKSAKVSATYSYTVTTSGVLMNNTGRFAVFSFGGTFSLDSLSVFSKEVRNADILIIGDSKTQGYDAGAIDMSYGHLLRTKFPKLVISAGHTDKLVETLTHTSEYIALKPKQVLLAIGSNDIRAGRSTSAYFADYDTLVNRLTAVGIIVYHLLPFYETGISVTPLYNHIVATYPASNIIDTYTPITLSGSLDADAIHPTPLGHRYIYEAILSSGKLFGSTNKTSLSPNAIAFGATDGSEISSPNLTYSTFYSQLQAGTKVRLGTNSGGFGTLVLNGNDISAVNGGTLTQVNNDLYINKAGSLYITSNTGAAEITETGGNLTATGVVTASGGAVVPSQFGYFWGSTGSGYYLASTTGASGHMDFNLNGGEAARFSINKNLLINTTTDDGINKLQVSGSITTTQYRLSALNTAPLNSTDTGTTGEIRFVNGFMYVCVATNTWQRTVLSTF